MPKKRCKLAKSKSSQFCNTVVLLFSGIQKWENETGAGRWPGGMQEKGNAAGGMLKQKKNCFA